MIFKVATLLGPVEEKSAIVTRFDEDYIILKQNFERNDLTLEIFKDIDEMGFIGCMSTQKVDLISSKQVSFRLDSALRRAQKFLFMKSYGGQLSM